MMNAGTAGGWRAQLVRYLSVGAFNTVLGYGLFVGFNRAFSMLPRGYVLASLAARDPRLARANQILWPFLGLLAAFYILCNIPAYHWYYAPFLFFGIIYAARLLPISGTVYTTCLVLVAFAALDNIDYLRKNSTENVPYAEMGRWMTQHTPVNSTIASSETGTIGWYCDRRIIDMVGLTTPANARYTAKADFNSWFKDRPDYVIVHETTPFPWELIAKQSSEYEYVPVHFDNVYLMVRKGFDTTRP